MRQSVEVGHPSAEVRLSRWAVLAVFLLNGVGIASWAAHVPYIKQKFALSEAVLGLALLAVACGSVVTLLLGGQLVARFGSRAVTVVGELLFCLMLPLLVMVPSFPLLIGVLILFGACIGAMEVAANVQALQVEVLYGRPIMSTFHALFSVGGLAGASLAGVWLAQGLTPQSHMLLVALGLGLLTLMGMRFLVTHDPPQQHDAPVIALPRGPLWPLGLLAFFCLVAEGAMADWSAVYLRTILQTDAAFAAAGYAAFSLAMAAGRFVGDSLRARFDAPLLVRSSGALAALGLIIAVLVPYPIATLIGFACVGLGLSNVVPVLFSAAGNTPGVAAGTGIAAVATLGYFGFLIGPPLIGFASQLSSLRGGLLLVALFMLIIVVMAGRTSFGAHQR